MDEVVTMKVRPLVEADTESAPFFYGAAEHKLMLRHCKACGSWNAPQAVFCMECLKAELEWAEASGKGTVHTFTIIHRAQIEGIDAPYNVTVVELEEGPRIVSQIVGCGNDEIKVGMPVEVEFRKLTNGISLPYFGPHHERRMTA